MYWQKRLITPYSVSSPVALPSMRLVLIQLGKGQQRQLSSNDLYHSKTLSLLSICCCLS